MGENAHYVEKMRETPFGTFMDALREKQMSNAFQNSYQKLYVKPNTAFYTNGNGSSYCF